jgi:phosphate starvation-inducible PhoH-like protein
MLMFLTRLGPYSRAVVTGDITQIDLPDTTASGLVQACRILDGVAGIGIVHLSERDIVRHPLVRSIVAAYDADRRRPAGPSGSAEGPEDVDSGTKGPDR